MKLEIRKECISDYPYVDHVIGQASKSMAFSDGNEVELVRKIRKGNKYINDLSLIALFENKIVGQILFIPIKIISNENIFKSLALAPMSVLPEFQNKGIGSKLVQDGLKKAKELKYHSVIVLGHEKYYPKFGFKPASFFNIKPPFNLPDEVFMALELYDGSLAKVSGTVQYPDEFN